MVVSMLTVAAVSAGAADSSGTTTITVGVINYVINELGNTGYKVHYWGGADGAKDADLTATGKTEKKSVGKAYWNGDEQTFTMFTATVPSDFAGYKVHNGDRWFGDDGTPDKTTAYIFNYSGDKALYEVSAEPVTEPATLAPATDAPAEMAYYLVGSMNSWTAQDSYKLSKNIAVTDTEEYLLSGVKLAEGDEFKVVCTNGDPTTAVWFPAEEGNYVVRKDGIYTVYFRPNKDGYEDWYLGMINAIEEIIETEPATDTPTEPATEEPSTPVSEGSYYIVGTMTGWKVDEAYKLSKNDASVDIEEYLFNDLALETTDEFKVVYSEDGTAMTKWFPEGSDNNYGGNGEITEAGTYILYFRPHYDGFEDWFNGCIMVIINKPEPLLGDVDMDGDVDIQDATLLQSCLIEAKTLTDEQFKLADVNQDGVVNVRDVTAIQRIVAEMS